VATSCHAFAPRWAQRRQSTLAKQRSGQPVARLSTVESVITPDEAARLGERLLADPLPRRWRHVRSVGRRARWVAKQLALPDDLESAAWLHDIGYAPDLVRAGFHPLDGARYLRNAGIDGQVVSLVAYHSCAQIEADVRGLGAELASEFAPADPMLADALLYCDMTTGPDGDYVRPAVRLVEIRGRYGPDHEVTRFVERAASQILSTAARVEELLAAQPR
jgi:predicted hydrolase (HD superfamily)